LNETDIRVC